MLYPKCTRSLSTVLVPLTHRSATRPKTPGLWLELLCLAPAARAAAGRSPVLKFWPQELVIRAPLSLHLRQCTCTVLGPRPLLPLALFARPLHPPPPLPAAPPPPLPAAPPPPLAPARCVSLAGSIWRPSQIHFRSISGPSQMQMCLPVRGAALSESNGSCSSCACSYALQGPPATAVPAVSRRPTTLHRARVQ